MILWRPCNTLAAAPLLTLLVLFVFPAAAADSLQEIIVSSSLRDTRVSDLPQSVTVVNHQTLQAAGVQHLEDVLSLIPDLNWASATSRPRFFQLRGIGEVEQYQGAPNPSVGFLIDDIDFSGVGMPATLFDTQQIEVLRGPQGTAYGANALAGLISVRTVDPGSDFTLHSEVTGGTYDTRAAALAVGDGFGSGTAGWRLAAQQYASDGFRHDAYLGKNSTNGFNEGTIRGKVRWQMTDELSATLTLMHVNINNGYDAWSIDNSRTTYSNQPGRDAQLSNGAALRLTASISPLGELRSITSAADSKITYSFDGDWGNDPLWGPYAPYDFFQSDNRTRRTLAEDLRITSGPDSKLPGRVRWLAGIYALRLTESDSLRYFYNDQPDGAGRSGLNSQYSATNIALYGSLDANLNTHTVVSGGLRLERRAANYADDADAAFGFPKQTNRMLGGNFSLTRSVGERGHVYATLARGYKGGGFNIGSQILSEQRGFGPESVLSGEAGLKYAGSDNGLQLQTDVFYMRRERMQVYLSEQLQKGNPLAYVFYTENASNGENYGLEAELSYPLNDRWQVTGSASLLRTRYLGVTGVFTGFSIDGRSQPFAPGYKLATAIIYNHPAGWFARFDLSALDKFYYSSSDSQTSSAYNLENLRAGYTRHNWTTSIWVRNLIDARYAQQGFYFGLIPPNYPNQSFLDRGDPRQIGITVAYQLRP